MFVGVCDLSDRAKMGVLSSDCVFLGVQRFFAECLCGILCPCFAVSVYFELSSDGVFCVACERSVLVDTFWKVHVFSCWFVWIFLPVCILDCVGMFCNVWVNLFFGVFESWDKLVFCPLLLCSWEHRCFEKFMFCATCVFFCLCLFCRLWVTFCCVCTFCLVRFLLWICVLASVFFFWGAWKSVFFDVHLCARVCLWECLCVVRCMSLNSLRDRKRTLRTKRSSHHGIPSLMSCRVIDTNTISLADTTGYWLFFFELCKFHKAHHITLLCF